MLHTRLSIIIFHLLAWRTGAFLVRYPNIVFRRSFVAGANLRPTKSMRFQSSSSSSSNQEDFGIPKLQDATCDGRDVIKHIKYLHNSLLNLSGRGVYERMNATITTDSSDEHIYESICKNEDYVLISHGKQEDPIYNFGNIACLQAFARSWESLTAMPSRLCVVSESEDETMRNELMHNVTTQGLFDGKYSGYRIRGDGKFIKITELCVWNCHDDDGNYIGQAALYSMGASPVVDSIID